MEIANKPTKLNKSEEITMIEKVQIVVFKINLELLNLQIETITEDNQSSGTSNQDGVSNSNNKRTLYNLPYKQTNERYATNETIDESDTNTEVQNTYNGNETKELTKTKTGNVNVLEQKMMYMKYIRDIYLEFVELFKTCFSMVYA